MVRSLQIFRVKGLTLWESTLQGGRVTTRLTAGAGQLVDAIVQMDRNAVFVDVYSQTEGVTERKSAAEGGYESSTGNEINGISLVGVGRGTVLACTHCTRNWLPR